MGRLFLGRLTLRAQRALYGYLFVSPWVVGFLVLLGWPLFYSFWLGLHDVAVRGGLVLTPIGLDNYREALLEDVRFGPLYGETLGNLLIDLPIIVVFSLGVALLVSQPPRGRTLFRVILFMPVVIGSAYVVRELGNQGVGSQAIARNLTDLESLLTLYLGQGTFGPLLALINRITLILWRSGVPIVIFIAALHSIPRHFYEAARVDGGEGWGVFWKITLPLLTPFILVNVIYTIVDSFTDPFNRTLLYIQQIALTGRRRLGYGAALGWAYFAAIFVVMVAVVLLSRRLVYYAGERM